MKTYQEMAAAVFRRAEEYEQRQRRIRRRLCIAGSSATCFMLLLAGAALMQHRGKTPRRTGGDIRPDETATQVYAPEVAAEHVVPESAPESGVPHTQNGTADHAAAVTEIAPEMSTAHVPQTTEPDGTVLFTSGTEIPGTVTGVTGSAANPVSTQGGTEDFCRFFASAVYRLPGHDPSPADAHRPAGYHENISSTLAIVLSHNADARSFWYRQGFDVLVTGLPDASPDGFFSFAYDGQVYDYRILKTEQILEYAASGCKLYYLGSGKGDPNAAGWGSDAAADAWCELFGDGFTSAPVPGAELVKMMPVPE